MTLSLATPIQEKVGHENFTVSVVQRFWCIVTPFKLLRPWSYVLFKKMWLQHKKYLMVPFLRSCHSYWFYIVYLLVEILILYTNLAKCFEVLWQQKACFWNHCQFIDLFKKTLIRSVWNTCTCTCAITVADYKKFYTSFCFYNRLIVRLYCSYEVWGRSRGEHFNMPWQEAGVVWSIQHGGVYLLHPCS